MLHHWYIAHYKELNATSNLKLQQQKGAQSAGGKRVKRAGREQKKGPAFSLGEERGPMKAIKAQEKEYREKEEKREG